MKHILILILAFHFTSGQFRQHQEQQQTRIVHTIQKDLDTLEDKIKTDLNEKFSKLSAQLDENDRRVKKTLSIFEAEWIDKSKRLSDLEERQQRVEQSIMRLTKIVNEIRYPQTTTTWTPFPETPDETSEEDVPETKVEEVPGTIKEVLHVPEIPEKKMGEVPEMTKEVLPVLEIPETSYVSVRPPILLNVPSSMRVPTLNSDGKTFALIGTRNDYEIMDEPIPAEEQVELSSIQLEYVQLTPEILLESLQNCSKLKSLKLIQVKIIGEFDTRVHLPELEEFVLDQVGVLQFSNHTIFSKWSEIDDFLRGFDEGSLTSSMFFYKDDPDWDLEDISDLKTNVDLIVDGVKILKINHDQGIVTSMLKYSPDLLRNLGEDFVLRKLAVSAWRIDLDALPETLTHLNFNYIQNMKDLRSKMNLTEKLKNLKYLQELNTFIGNHGNTSVLNWSWASLPHTIKNLTIRFSDVKYDPNTNSTLSLENLYLHYCKLDSTFANNFHKAFDSQSVAVTFRIDNRVSARIEHELLLSILKTNATWIFIQNFNRVAPQGKDLTSFWTAETFLLDAGVSQYTHHFILQKRNGTWEGWNVSREGQLILTYQLVGTDQFVTFGTYKKIVG